MRRDEKMVSALLAHGADAERAAADLDADPPLVERLSISRPELVGATPFWLAARFTEPAVMRLLVKHGADPLFVHHGEYMTAGSGQQRIHHRTYDDHGADGGDRHGRRRDGVGASPIASEREALTLEAVKLAVELGVDVNAANTDGRTALDAAKTLKYDTVVEFLVEQGAREGRRK